MTMTAPRLSAAIAFNVYDIPTVYLAKGTWVTCYSKYDTGWEMVGPFSTARHVARWWPKLVRTVGRTGFDAAWRDSKGLMWFTHGDDLVQYDPQKLNVYTDKTLSGTIGSLPEGFNKGVDAAFNTSQRVYLFKGKKYCSAKNNVAGEARDLGVLNSVDAAMVADGTVYLFSGDSCYTATVDDKKATVTVDADSKTKITDIWPAAPLGTPTLDLYYHNAQLIRVRTDLDITTYESGNPGKITAKCVPLENDLSSPEPPNFRFYATSDNRRAYVPDPGTKALSALDLTADKPPVVWSQALGTFVRPASAVEWDSVWAVTVDNQNARSITGVRIKNGQPKPESKPFTNALGQAITVSPDSSKVYVSSTPTGNDFAISPVDTQTLTPGDPIDKGTRRPLDLAITPDGNKLYAVYEDKPKRKVRRITLGETPKGDDVAQGGGLLDIVVTPDGAAALATQSTDPSLIVIDTATDSPTTIPLKFGQQQAKSAVAVTVEPNSRYACVLDPSETPSIWVVDVAGKFVAGVIPLDPGGRSNAVAAAPRWS
ncbi:hypothetical protein [Saccharopolyspora spinosa]|uniref:YVTN family beta-propeller protein n=1 Tax=Saccharopolyspora spinosa TaxID=60894 RepID=A0A2N3Y6I4_SACSN|nr:hypothetical protein [Saccharopolyspora spinosa]PKW18544.1 hypothetical protein A8926_6639 [Saccharopolyspora spinosa]